MNNVCRECGIEFEKVESLRRHVRKHNVSFQEYSLKWNYSGIVPLCQCGCNQEVAWNVGYKKYADFVRGHSALGKKRTEEQKRKIGEKNSVNMKNFMEKNPEIAIQRVKEMHKASHVPEVTTRRIQATKDAYANMTIEDLQIFSNHAKKLWSSGIMNHVAEKQSKTFKERFLAGEYDFTQRNDKISQAISQRYIEGGFSWCKGKYTSTKTGKTINYRSSWELNYAMFLDRCDDVESWEYEFTIIPYELDGSNRRYLPDFYVRMKDGTKKLVEVKPESLKETKMNLAKREAAELFCASNGWIYEESNGVE